MSEQELTPWFVNGEKPCISGVYEVRPTKVAYPRILYAYFDVQVQKWGAGRETQNLAKLARNKGVIPDNYYHYYGSWRGLAHPPKAKP